MPRTTLGQLAVCAIGVAFTTACMVVYMQMLDLARARGTVDRLTPFLLALALGALALCSLAYVLGVALLRVLESKRVRNLWAEIVRA